jgi:hypothetical protein
MDLDSIPFGVDFRTHISEALSGCQTLLVVIGPHWLGVSADGSRRIDDPTDFVRLEVAQALAQAIRVIPLLIDRTEMPSSTDLPDDLKSLAFRNALRVDSGADFRHHMNRLCSSLGMTAEDPAKRAMPPVASSVDSRPKRSQQDSVATAKEPTPPVKSAQKTIILLYLEMFVALLCKPEASLAERAVDTDEEFRRALVFFAISTFLVSPLVQSIGMIAGNFWTSLWNQLVFTVFVGLDLIGILALSFRLVGARPKLRTLCITYFYVWGVFGVIYHLSTVVGSAILHAFKPDTFLAVQDAYSKVRPIPILFGGERERVSGLPGYKLYDSLAGPGGLGSSLALIWLFIAWGAFRRLVSLSKRQSAVAMVLFFSLTVVGAILFFQIVEAIGAASSH